MMRGNIRGLVGFLVIGALVAMRYHAAEAAAIDGNSGTIVLRGAVSESQPSGPIGEGAPVVLRGSPSQHPQPAPERSDCDPSHYYDPDRGCVAPEVIYSPDYGYWPDYGLGWPYFGLQHRHPRHGFSHRRFPGQTVHLARHPVRGFGRGFARH